MTVSPVAARRPPQPYTDEFFAALGAGARRSAGVIAPIVHDLVRPGAVVDVGCGTGIWLAAFRALGVDDILGLDGEYVAREALAIPAASFRACDLARPIGLERRFDLVVSLEVAEHLPAAGAARFVASLTALGPAVLFSAAIPRQGGVHHVNERWQDEWAALFRARGYLPVDCVRWRVWDDERVEYWYAQNTILYVEADHLAGHATLRAEAARWAGLPLRVVHPRRYAELTALLDWPRRLVPRPARERLLRAFDHWQRRRGARRAG